MHPERQAFENAIDENPLDATNHLVYADWLDEHGEPDEAAFRRAMGDWIYAGGRHSYHGPDPDPYHDRNRWYANNLPKGTELDVNTRAFPSYRTMEGHFREAFLKNRQRRMQRRSLAKRYSRSKR